MRSHEVNGFRRHFVGSHHEIAFVLAIGIIRHYDDAALGDVTYHIVNSIKPKCLLRLGDHRNNTITSPAALSNSYSCSWSYSLSKILEHEHEDDRERLINRRVGLRF